MVIKCAKCGKKTKTRKDGLVAKHRMDVGRGDKSGTSPCPASETHFYDWTFPESAWVVK